jgi:protein SCO1/2
MKSIPGKRQRWVGSLLAGLFVAAATAGAAAAPESAMPCHEPETASAATESPAAPSASSPVDVDGLQVPDVALRDQDGREVRFYRDLVEGHKVLVNFVFTTCTTICPPMGATFGKVQAILGDRAGRDVRLISVSVDPAVDTPERLKAWAAKFGAGPGWTLLTGSKEEIDRLRRALGVYTADKSDHSPLVLAGDAGAGRWKRAYGLARPEELIALVDGLAAPRTAAVPASPAATTNIEGAP